MQIGRYPSESSHEGKTIWQMYFRYGQVAGHEKCGQCRYFNQNHCLLFNGDNSVDWSGGWVACDAVWAHEGEVSE